MLAKSKEENGRNGAFRERIQVVHTIDKNRKENREKESNKFYEIMKYLKEKKRLIYVKMQSPIDEQQQLGIVEWDKIEELIEEVKENRNNKEYLKALYSKISDLKEREKGINRSL